MKIHIDGLVFERGGDEVLRIDALTIAEARTTVLFGPNGAGKTTLLRLISGLERPTRGTIRLGERLVDTARPPVDRLAFAFQKAVYLRASVRANLELGLRLRGLGADERIQRIGDVADKLAITALLERPCDELSHGEAQRMSLARALSLRAAVTLLDEPLAGLDAITRNRMLDQLPGWLAAPSTTALVVTHDRDEALRIADDLVILDQGRLLAHGEVGALLSKPPSKRAAELLGFTLLRHGEQLIAVPPGALQVHESAAGGPFFELAVERIVDLGERREAIGKIGDLRVRALLVDGARATAGEHATAVAMRHLSLAEEER